MVNSRVQNDGWDNEKREELKKYYTKLCNSNIFPELKKNTKGNIADIINKSVDLHIELSKLKTDDVKKIIKENEIKKIGTKKGGGSEANEIWSDFWRRFKYFELQHGSC